jgi:hypothetical protein
VVVLILASELQVVRGGRQQSTPEIKETMGVSITRFGCGPPWVKKLSKPVAGLAPGMVHIQSMLQFSGGRPPPALVDRVEESLL